MKVWIFEVNGVVIMFYFTIGVLVLIVGLLE